MPRQRRNDQIVCIVRADRCNHVGALDVHGFEHLRVVHFGKEEVTRQFIGLSNQPFEQQTPHHQLRVERRLSSIVPKG